MNRDQRLRQFATAAVMVERELGYPPQLLVAQWACESRWGEQVSGKNNYFGMTRADRHREWEWCCTREVLTDAGVASLDPEEQARIALKTMRDDGKWEVRLERRFASYGSIMDGIKDKVTLIMTSPRYEPAFRHYQISGDVMALIDGVARAGYATDPNYAATLKKIAVQNNVLSAIKTARLALT